MGRWPTIVVSLLAVTAGCSSSETLQALKVNMPTGVEAQRLELYIVDDCDNRVPGVEPLDAMRTIQVRKGESGEDNVIGLGAISVKRAAIFAYARNSDCEVVASTCEEVTFLGNDPLEVTLDEVTNGTRCAVGVTCAAGRCVPPNMGGCIGCGCFDSVEAGHGTTCAIESTGDLYCWGSNLSGQVGANVTGATVVAPEKVLSNTNVDPNDEEDFYAPNDELNWVSVGLGLEHTCAVSDTTIDPLSPYDVHCWGMNGDPGIDSDFRLGPMVALVSLYTGKLPITGRTWEYVTPKLAVGANAACVVRVDPETMDHNVDCWGTNDHLQVQGAPIEMQDEPPSEVVVHTQWSSAEVDAVALGLDFGCAAAGNLLMCWGHNGHGQLGRGTASLTNEQPGNLFALNNELSANWKTAQLEAGNRHVCARTEVGAIHCWGWDHRGQLGDGVARDGQTPFSATPVTVDLGGAAAVDVSAGQDHTCAITTEGELYCWGNNGEGQLGIGISPVSANTPQRVNPTWSDWADVSAGDDYTCAVRQTGTLYCWGNNASGQLGLHNTAPTNVPTRVCLQDAQDPAQP